MAQDRRERIAEIIRIRTPLIKEIEKKREDLRRRYIAMRSLYDLQQQIIKSNVPMMTERLKTLDFSPLLKMIEQEMRELDKLKLRFSRPTLNIGVIGRARKGKSTLLQSISGLELNVIPTGRRGHCTAVRSMICHDPKQQQPKGIITFYTEQEFIDEVIAPYYEKLDLGSAPKSVEAFSSSRLPPLPSKLPGSLIGQQHEYLERYHTNLANYRHLLGEPPRTVGIREVRKYVAQDEEDGARDTSFHFLAVREAKIICNFRNDDVGQIALVDMPGLGDTGIGAEDRLVKTLGEHIDSVLFVLMPTGVASILEDIDYKLYDLTYKALDGLPINYWSFAVLNHTKPPSFADNIVNCQDIKALIDNSRNPAPGRNFSVVDTLIADCNDPDEAGKIVLDKVLDYLTRNIKGLDMQYLSSRRTSLAHLQEEIDRMLEKARQIADVALSQVRDTLLFAELFKKLWEELNNELVALVEDMQKERRNPNTTFATYFKDTFTLCRSDSGLPTRERVKAEMIDENAAINAYNHFLDEIRTHLTHHFMNMDEQLKFSMDSVKDRVASVFIQTGQLKNLMMKVPESEFFRVMAEEKLPEGLKHLCEVFRAFANFELSLRGFFQSRIRMSMPGNTNSAYLDNLLPDRTKFKPMPATPDGVPSPDTVLQTLKAVHKESVDNLEKALSFIVFEPSEAAYAIVEEFVDQVLHSKDVEDAWRNFYSIRKAQVWKTEFEQSEKWEKLQKEWQRGTQEVFAVHQANSLPVFNLSPSPSQAKL